MAWARFDQALVCTRTEDLATLPALPETPGCGFREMDMGAGIDVATWLAVHNDAYDHDWDAEQFERAILRHPYFDVWKTFFALEGETAVGAASIGVFRGNPSVGVGHYLGVTKRAQRLGVGRSLVVYRYHALRDAGIVQCESQTHIGRVGSLRIHFECGFVPKLHFDPWNTPNTAALPVRLLTNARLKGQYQRWRRERGRAATAGDP